MSFGGYISLTSKQFKLNTDSKASQYDDTDATFYCYGHCLSAHGELVDAKRLANYYKENHSLFFLEFLSGAFVALIIDKINNEIYLIRDKVGQIELYYAIQADTLYFSTHIYVLREQGVTLEIDRDILYQSFLQHATLWNQTIFKSVFSVDASEYICFNNGIVKKCKYYEFVFSPETKIGFNEGYSLVANALKYSVESLDNNCAIMLSGGLDSAIVASLYKRKVMNKIPCFSITQQDLDYDESRYQKEMAEYLGASHYSIFLDEASIINGFIEIGVKLNKPIFSPGAIGIYLLGKQMSEYGYKTALDGQGADEFFGGYSWFIETFADTPGKHQALLDELINKYPMLNITAIDSYGLYLSKLFSIDYDASIFSYKIPTDVILGHTLQQLVKTKNLTNMTTLQKLQLHAINLGLKEYALSALGNQMTLLNDVNIVHPFLDQKVLSVALQLSDECKIMNGIEKYVLKNIAHDIIPQNIIWRKKNPYKIKTNIDSLMKHHYVNQIIKNSTIFDGDYLLYLYEKKHLACHTLFGILSTEAICSKGV